MLLDILKKKLFSNISFVLLVFGAGSNFLLTIFVKKTFSVHEFNTYSLFLTYIGVISSFGLIGLDQVFLRLSKIENQKKVCINKDVLTSIIIAVFVVPIFVSIYFSQKSLNIHLYQFIATGIGINIIILNYNIFRLISEFSKAQIFKNGYRILFLIVLASLVLLFNVSLNITEVINIVVVIVTIFALIGFYVIWYKTILVNEKTFNFLHFFISFSINLALITILSFGERILILDNIGENEFGKYFYYSTIFLFPLTLIQQYVGFKELVGFKKQINANIVRLKTKTIIVLGFAIVFLIVIVSIIDGGYFLEIDYKSDYVLIILLSLLGITKLIYGIFSAILGAIGNTNEIYHINILTVVFILLSLVYLYLFSMTLVSIVCCLIIVFLLRSFFIYYKYVISAKR